MTTDHIIKLKGGRKLAFCEYGDPRGKPIFYFHGWPASRLSGQETHEAAKKLGVRVISPDRPGFGLSDYAKDRTLLSWARDVEELADKLKIKKFAIMGVSGGGPYVAACTYVLPERITKAGIIVGMAPTYVKGIMKGMPKIFKFGWYLYRKVSFSAWIGALIGTIEYKYFPVIGRSLGLQAIEDRILLKKEKYTFESAKEGYRQGIKGPALDLHLYSNDWNFELSKIKSKVYLWYGAKDKNVPLKMGKYYKKHIPHSELFIDPNGGHLNRWTFEDKILKTILN